MSQSSGDQDPATRSAPESPEMNDQSTESQSSPLPPKLPQYVFVLGLFACIAPVVTYVFGWLFLAHASALLSAWLAAAGPVAVVLAIIVRIRNRRRPESPPPVQRRFRMGVAGGVFGIVWLGVALLLHLVIDGPWSIQRRALVCTDLKALRPNVLEYADAHEGRYPDDPNDLSSFEWCVGMIIAKHAYFPGDPHDPGVDIYCVPGLTRDDPRNWVLLYVDSSLFAGRGGAVLYVNGEYAVLPEPEFRATLEAFKADYTRQRGTPPTILRLHRPAILMATD